MLGKVPKLRKIFFFDPMRPTYPRNYLEINTSLSTPLLPFLNNIALPITKTLRGRMVPQRPKDVRLIETIEARLTSPGIQVQPQRLEPLARLQHSLDLARRDICPLIRAP